MQPTTDVYYVIVNRHGYFYTHNRPAVLAGGWTGQFESAYQWVHKEEALVFKEENLTDGVVVEVTVTSKFKRLTDDSMRKQALAKLTPEEQKALGL